MHFKEALIESKDNPNVHYLAPIPVWVEQFNDDELHNKIYKLGMDRLSDKQKLMGQELPEQLDTERIESYEVNYQRKNNWVEPNEFNPIGSRFFTPPNNFLDIDNDGFLELITVESYNYAGWGIRVYKNINGESFQDVTSTYFTDPIQMHSGASGPFSQQQQGDLGVSYDIQILDIDNDGDYDILPSYPSLEDEASTVKTAYFENNNGLFSLIKITE